MCKKTAKSIICFFIVFLLFFAVNIYEVKADKKNNEIYSFEKDGYWRPTDDIGHDFYIENLWEEECYLEGIGFKRVSIKDISNDKVYNENEAVSSGIMDDKYYVTINQGEKVLYSGKMSELMKQEYITLDEPIFLELDTKSLLAVNGGTDCSGSSSPSSPSDSGGGGSGGPGSSTTSSVFGLSRPYLSSMTSGANARIPSALLRIGMRYSDSPTPPEKFQSLATVSASAGFENRPCISPSRRVLIDCGWTPGDLNLYVSLPTVTLDALSVIG